ncbi:hypothetical protein VTO42DRAFT_6762 [Malbranchea cinnamomea]
MSKFYFGDSDESDASLNDNDDNLPFPKPLTREAFLTPDFDPATFLSSLSNRHQTLGDLQAELRELSQSLNKELFDLVNENYQDFLSLGTALRGGEEKVEEARAGLLAFEREVQSIRDQFAARTRELRTLLNEKKRLRSDIALGYTLLDISDRIDTLEQRLMIRSTARVGVSGEDSKDEREDGNDINNEDWEFSDEILHGETDKSDEDTGDGATVICLRRLERHINDYLCLKTIVDGVGDQHPFIVNQKDRIAAIRSALILDINTALKQAAGSANRRQERTFKALCLYDLVGDGTEIVSALKKLKT